MATLNRRSMTVNNSKGENIYVTNKKMIIYLKATDL